MHSSTIQHHKHAFSLFTMTASNNLHTILKYNKHLFIFTAILHSFAANKNKMATKVNSKDSVLSA